MALSNDKKQKIINYCEDGKSLRQIAKILKIGRETIRQELSANKEFEAHYARAKQNFYEEKAEYMHELEAELKRLVLDEEIDNKTKNALVQAYKLEIDNIKWFLCKLLPKKYGDRQQIEQTHDVSGNLKEILQKHIVVKELGQDVPKG
jgi:IS30 family transposase